MHFVFCRVVENEDYSPKLIINWIDIAAHESKLVDAAGIGLLLSMMSDFEDKIILCRYREKPITANQYSFEREMS